MTSASWGHAAHDRGDLRGEIGRDVDVEVAELEQAKSVEFWGELWERPSVLDGFDAEEISVGAFPEAGQFEALSCDRSMLR